MLDGTLDEEETLSPLGEQPPLPSCAQPNWPWRGELSLLPHKLRQRPGLQLAENAPRAYPCLKRMTEPDLLSHILAAVETMLRIVELARAGKSARRINIKLAEEGLCSSNGRPWTKTAGQDLKVISRVLHSQKMEAVLSDAEADSDLEERQSSPSALGDAETSLLDTDVELFEQTVEAAHMEAGTAAVAAAIGLNQMQTVRLRRSKGGRRVTRRKSSMEAHRDALHNEENEGQPNGPARVSPREYRICADLDDGDVCDAYGSDPVSCDGAATPPGGIDMLKRPNLRRCRQEAILRASSAETEEDATLLHAKQCSAPPSCKESTLFRQAQQAPKQKAKDKPPKRERTPARSSTARRASLKTMQQKRKKRTPKEEDWDSSEMYSLRSLGVCFFLVECEGQCCRFSNDVVCNYEDLATLVKDELKLSTEISGFFEKDPSGRMLRIGTDAGLYSSVQNAIQSAPLNLHPRGSRCKRGPPTVQLLAFEKFPPMLMTNVDDTTHGTVLVNA